MISRRGNFLSGLHRRQLRATVLWAVALVLLLALVFLDVWIDEPFRRYVAGAMNRALVGYSVRLPAADLRPWNLSVKITGLEVRQDAHPEPPVATLGSGTLSIQWRSLFRGKVVADMNLEKPAIVLDSRQAASESDDDVAVEDRGWQDVLEWYPLKIDSVKIRDGSVSYRDRPSGRRLELDQVALDTGNIRHIAGPRGRYPSPLRLTARVFEEGSLALDGRADFLLRPHAGMNVVVDLKDAPLEPFGPLVDDYRIRLKGGRVAARGQLEVLPENYIANLQSLKLDRLKVDYVDSPPTADTRKAAEVAAETARTVDRSPEVRLRLQSLQVQGEVGYVSAGPDPYRIFVTDADLRGSNLSNRTWQGQSNFSLSGAFMGSGATRVRGVWRPEEGPPNFAVDARITDTELPAMNDLLRRYGRLDVSQGKFSLYSQLYARKGALRGYVKPLFSDVDVLGPEDKDEPALKRFYEFIVEKVAALLENRERDEVASVADLSGDVSNPDVSAWQVVGNLLKNAFIEAILPGFDRSRGAKAEAKAEEAPKDD